MEEIVEEFLVESLENLDQLDSDLLALENDPANRNAIASIFRTVHTIKGTCGFLGYTTLESVTHVGENLLSRLRDDELSIDAEIADALLAMSDAVRAILGNIERTGAEGDADYTALVERLGALQERAERDDDTAAAGDADVDADAPIGEILVAEGTASEVDVAIGLIEQREGDPRHLGEILVEQGAVEPAEVREALERQIDQRSGVAESSIRVDVALLDDLMNLVGELVLARNQILQWGAARAVDSMFVSTSQRLNLITTELQARMMKTRMQPVANVWGKLPRVVRDLAGKCAKQVAVVMEGQETELDKTVIEAIKDPLTHLVRNAVDHGLESPDVRVARGKPAQGVVSLRAYHEGGQVNIEIADDGNGIDIERVKAKAVERGLLRPDDADRIGDREAMNLVFLPGFSTAEEVTAVSGRGVGMDVVKTNIEAIGGSLDVASSLGGGTTFRIKIPLTLAIVPALVVTAGGDTFAIPQVNLLELVRLDPGSTSRIEHVQGAPVYRLRGDILPIVSLRDELLLFTTADQTDEDPVNIVVLQAEDRQFGLVVDEISDTEEIVVKPLAPQLQSIVVFSGCTIMGDGSVALILDVLGLAQRAGVLSERSERRLAERDVAARAADEEQSLLVVQLGTDGRAAVPLSLVHRLEEIERDMIERSAGREVVQYRGGIMPLVRAADVLDVRHADANDGPLQVVVYDDDGRSVGLVVERVLDIVSAPASPPTMGGVFGIRDSVILAGGVTDLLDVPAIIARSLGADSARELAEAAQ